MYAIVSIFQLISLFLIIMMIFILRSKLTFNYFILKVFVFYL